MPRYESLEAKALRKLSPRIIQSLPSPVVNNAREELAKHIQRTFRTRNYLATHRKGSKMTINAMRRQLIDVWSSPTTLTPAFHSFLNRPFLNSIDGLELSEPEKIIFLINNIQRPLLEELYNNTWMLRDDEEDVEHITNPTYFTQAGKRRTKRKLRKRKSKKRKSLKRKHKKDKKKKL
jgi:hypothetical protein